MMAWLDRVLCRLARTALWLVARRFNPAKQRVFWITFTTRKPSVDPATGKFVEPHGHAWVAFGPPEGKRLLWSMGMRSEAMDQLADSLGVVLDAQYQQYEVAMGVDLSDE